MAEPVRLRVHLGDEDPLRPPMVVEVPATYAASLHVHIHVSGEGSDDTSLSNGSRAVASSGVVGRRIRSVVLSCAALSVVSLLAFEFGARSGEGRATAEAASRSQAQASLAQNSARPEATAGDALDVVRRRLEQPAEVTPAPVSPVRPVPSNPFGLQQP